MFADLVEDLHFEQFHASVRDDYFECLAGETVLVTGGTGGFGRPRR
jgi:FlaA1/EpsC-like NDP-sugar epimerase